jgi:hypothetical protein
MYVKQEEAQGVTGLFTPRIRRSLVIEMFGFCFEHLLEKHDRGTNSTIVTKQRSALKQFDRLPRRYCVSIERLPTSHTSVTPSLHSPDSLIRAYQYLSFSGMQYSKRSHHSFVSSAPDETMSSPPRSPAFVNRAKKASGSSVLGSLNAICKSGAM